MKTKDAPKDAPKDLTLIQLFDRFGTDEKARKHLEKVLWPNGIVCPKCQCNDQKKFSDIAPNAAAKTRAGLRWCSNCKDKFTVTIGTIFEDSHIPLRKWLIAWYLLCSSKKGISSLQLQRLLELGSYRTALFMAHRIRHALKETGYPEKMSGTIEADECFIPTGTKNEAKGTRKLTPVFSMVQRGGEVRSKVMPTVNGANLKQAIRENVAICSEVHTDMNQAYAGLEPKFTHKTVKHAAREFSRREGENIVSICGVESFFSLLKRGVVGTFHHVSAQHLPLYLAEFDHRHNCRKMTDGERTDVGLTKAFDVSQMKDPEINRIDGAIIGLTAMVAQLQGSELALQQLLAELKPTLTSDQQIIVSRYWAHTREQRKKLLDKFKPQLSPNDAALFEKILLAQQEPPPSFRNN
jgi:transposase-like protein